jgi:ligand-binding SRPBCC domain-containing protein
LDALDPGQLDVGQSDRQETEIQKLIHFVVVMVDIPSEIWRHIASFVSDEELWNLLEVNSVFFDIEMSIQWKEVPIMTRYTTEAMPILKRLS